MKIQPLLAEFLGTFFLCFAGIAAILSATPAVGSGAGIVGIALAHGLALSVAVNAFGGISGAHFNPAVSLGFFVAGRLPPLSLGPYIAVQLLGATTAALICRIIVRSRPGRRQLRLALALLGRAGRRRVCGGAPV